MHDLHRVLSKSYPLSLSSTSRISNLTILAIQGSILRTVSILTRDLDAREFVKECLLRPWKTKKEKKNAQKWTYVHVSLAHTVNHSMANHGLPFSQLRRP